MTRLRLGAEVVLLCVRVRRLLRRRPLPEVAAALRDCAAAADDVPDARLANATVRVLSALPGDSRCLVRALVLLALLARRGRDATIVLGVRREPGFLAHAWLERGGIELLPGGAGAYEALTRL